MMMKSLKVSRSAFQVPLIPFPLSSATGPCGGRMGVLYSQADPELSGGMRSGAGNIKPTSKHTS